MITLLFLDFTGTLHTWFGWLAKIQFLPAVLALNVGVILLWVVLTLREDYVAALDPYARLLPGRLRSRYYMQRMNAAAALEAITNPAQKEGRPFGPGVGQQLVDNLRQLGNEQGEGKEPGFAARSGFLAGLGEFVEHLVMPTVVRLFQAQGLEVHEVHSDVTAKRDGQGIQVDLLVVNDGVLIAIECKSKMTTAYVDQHVERMNKLKRMLPAYRHHQAFGAVAALVMPNDVAEYAEEQGFYVLVQSGETLTLRNAPAFQAKAW